MSSKQKKSVGVYGGSFDPPTNAHVGVMAAALQSGQCNEVWVVPSGVRHDKKLTASPTERFAMCHLAVETCFGARSKIFVRDDDLGSEEALSTLQLARQLRSANDDCDFLFIIGADLVASLPSWRDSAALLDECRFLVHPRPGYDADRSCGAKLEFLQSPSSSPTSQSDDPLALVTDHPLLATEPDLRSSLPLFELSSTDVRERAALCDDDDVDRFELLLDGLVPPAVKAFILRRRLYLRSSS